MTYTGSQAILDPPAVTLAIGESYSGEITYHYREGAQDSIEGLPTDAGTYTVVASIAAQGNYNAATSGELTLIISKAAPAVEDPSGITADYGDTLAEVALPTGWTWDAPHTSVSDVGEHTFSATYTPEDDQNYNTVTRDLTVTVSARYISDAAVILGEALIYNGQMQTQQISSVSVLGMPVTTYTVSGNTAADAGSYILTITFTGNFTGEVKMSWSIAKASYTGEKTASGTVLANWRDEVKLPAIPAGASYGMPSCADLTDMRITDGVLSYTGGSGIQKDETYTVRIPVTNAANYEDYSIVVTLTGSDKTELEITGVEAATGLVYSGQAQVGYTGTPSAVGYSGEFEITYSSDPIHAGEYTVTISIPESDVQFTGSVNLRFTIEPKPLTVAALDRNVYVGGKAPDLSAPAADADYTVEGLLGTDSLGGVVTMEYQKDGAAVTPNTAVPGSYAIVISCAGANPDYQVTCSNGLLTISPRPGSGTTTYNVNVADTAHGDVTASPKRASKSATVTVTTVPDEGYELAKLVVTDVHGNLVSFDDKGAGVFTFKMPGSEVTVTAVFRLRSAACAGGAGCPLRAFTDLTPTAWYHDGIHYCLANGLMDGVGNSRFAPDAAMSRAMVWTILARIHGETISGENWIDTARAWAMAEGVSDGTDANGMSPASSL